MATAMPEAEETYLYIERAMGPLFGTIAGVGTCFSLTFKGALALVGGAPYLVLLFDLPVTPVALTVAALLIVLNIVDAKQTGRMQIGIVAVMLAMMVWFIVVGAPSVERARFAGFFDSGLEAILGATGVVFVSYAGVTKIASVAEEVENPDRNLPGHPRLAYYHRWHLRRDCHRAGRSRRRGGTHRHGDADAGRGQ